MLFLIIDDDAVDRMAIVRVLNNSGLRIDEIIQTDSAEKGIQLAKSNTFDVILLDYRLPPSNGIEVLRLLQGTSTFSTAIVMLSHSNEEQLALKCVEAGAQDFLMKSEISGMRLKRAILLAKERFQLEQQVRLGHEQLRKLAEQDSLTGLSNRYFFDEALKSAIPQAIRENKTLALLLLDLDKFKNINDTHGHSAGDAFLIEVARRLKKPIREGDHLCRLGGDEFAILVQSLANPGMVRLLAHRIFEALKPPVEVNGQHISITASIGVAGFPDCATEAVDLLKCADVAMYRAKDAGRNQVHYYSRVVHKEIQHRILLENDLIHALKQEQLLLYYQPQVCSKSFELTGVEALIRWRHPEFGLIPPDKFIPIAEESGLINDVGRWVLETACKQYGEWIDRFPDQKIRFSIAANLSAKQLKDAGLVSHLRSSMTQYGLPASQLELELTESSLETSLSALDILNELAGLGITLALDDFGTGYSSMSHLQEYPFSVLKIDKVFVQNTTHDEGADFLKAISAFAHSLKFETVAEGVETEEQKELCASLGIDRLQGFLFSKPLPAEVLEKQWLQ